MTAETTVLLNRLLTKSSAHSKLRGALLEHPAVVQCQPQGLTRSQLRQSGSAARFRNVEICLDLPCFSAESWNVIVGSWKGAIA